ncbi:hypothetical protein K788_00003710 [Paraburkholderia caribensis MBA4]|uniref:Uncharacterized protein n=1 Tax=Paraburkholderia caribensis MBA4 TaxID=1323664 RepID=A0A0P0RIM8_9BURK|nr:hypothetical protein [Paraburkholderia caribensis]ALL68238.1 hypothetical protein K788_00003710 [Paraburkholderia caribensis MBA4]
MSAARSSFPVEFNLNAFFSAMPDSLKADARNGASHLKVLKAQGKCLQSHLMTSFSLEISAAQALDAAARSYGFTDYNQARDALLKTERDNASTLVARSSDAAALDTSSHPANTLSHLWVEQQKAWLEGGFFVDRSQMFGPDRFPADAVVTGLNIQFMGRPEGWHRGTTDNYAGAAFDGSESLIVSRSLLRMGFKNPTLSRQTSVLPPLLARANRLAHAGFRSFLVLENIRGVDDVKRFVEELLSTPNPFTPLVFGDDYSDFLCPEGVFDRLWTTSAYPIFIPMLETTMALAKTAPEVAKSLGVSEERALSLLMHVPRGHYLRIPPANPEAKA